LKKGRPRMKRGPHREPRIVELSPEEEDVLERRALEGHAMTAESIQKLLRARAGRAQSPQVTAFLREVQETLTSLAVEAGVLLTATKGKGKAARAEPDPERGRKQPNLKWSHYGKSGRKEIVHQSADALLDRKGTATALEMALQAAKSKRLVARMREMAFTNDARGWSTILRNAPEKYAYNKDTGEWSRKSKKEDAG